MPSMEGYEEQQTVSRRIRGWLRGLAPFVALFVIVFAAVLAAGYVQSGEPSADSTEGGWSDSCNVTGIEIRDCLATYAPETADGIPDPSVSDCDTITSSEEVVWALEEAAANQQIKAVVLEIDSGGGSPVAAEEIAAALAVLGKPSVAWVRESADSAAYWVASAADTIIASKSSDIGSIGVTYSYVDNAKKNIQDGLTYNQLTTGTYKDTGTPDRLLTTEERSLIQRDLDIILENFIAAVSANRHLSVEQVDALADGSTMLGQMALDNGLIDGLGTKQEVWQKLAEAVGAEPEVCWM